jgi:hypothetical protein
VAGRRSTSSTAAGRAAPDPMREVRCEVSSLCTPIRQLSSKCVAHMNNGQISDQTWSDTGGRMRTVNIHAAKTPAVATGRRLQQPARNSSSPKWASPSPTWALWPAREENAVSAPSTSAPTSSSSSALRNTTSFGLYRELGMAGRVLHRRAADRRRGARDGTSTYVAASEF